MLDFKIGNTTFRIRISVSENPVIRTSENPDFTHQYRVCATDKGTAITRAHILPRSRKSRRVFSRHDDTHVWPARGHITYYIVIIIIFFFSLDRLRFVLTRRLFFPHVYLSPPTPVLTTQHGGGGGQSA